MYFRSLAFRIGSGCEGYWMRRIFGAIAWMLASAILVLSIVPPSYRPETAAPHDGEHFAIYLATGIAFAIGYRDRLPIVTMGLLLFCGLIEISQLWVPGRHARLSDFLIDTAAACVGVGVTVVAEKWVLRRKFG